MSQSQPLSSSPSAPALMEKIIKFKWKQPDEQLALEVLAQKEQVLPLLVELVKERKYWVSSNENEWWAPITSIHLLSLTKDKRALDALIYVLYNYSEEMNDWLDSMGSLLSNFGISAFDSLASAVLDRTLDQWARNAAARAMMGVADKSGDESLRKRSIDCLKEAIKNERHRETRSWLVSEFSEMRDKESLPFIKSLFDAGMIDDTVTSYEEVKDVYAGRYESQSYLEHDTKDPMDYFRERENNKPNFEPSIESEEEGEEQMYDFTSSDIPSLTTHGKKLGRNDPCYCGSGKKYKKCCMKKDQTES